jgi:hypothetical protein
MNGHFVEPAFGEIYEIDASFRRIKIEMKVRARRIEKSRTLEETPPKGLGDESGYDRVDKGAWSRKRPISCSRASECSERSPRLWRISSLRSLLCCMTSRKT